jgi:diaminopimelate decarboxylase
VPILLRASVTTAARLELVRLVGDDGAGKFGMDREDLRLCARLAARSPHLDLLGLHAFGASNVREAAELAGHIATTVETARDLATEAGVALRLVDAGGGLGIPYDVDEESLDLAGLGARLRVLAAGWAADPVTRHMRVLLEPGRFLVGPAGAYLARVVDRKSVDNAHVVILDGGIHHLLRPALVGRSNGSTRSAGRRRPAPSGRRRSPDRSARGSTSSARMPS